MRRADWCEAYALASQRRLTKGRLISLLQSVAADLGDEAVEILAGETFQELRRRGGAAGKAYPFTVDRLSLRPDGTSSRRTLYSFFVLLSVHKVFRRPDQATDWRPDLIFEQVTRRALAIWVGGQAHVFSQLRPRIRPAIEHLGVLLGVDSHPELSRVQRKDHGLDVVAYRRFRDRPAGLPVLLCQCTISERKLVVKAREVVPAEWSRLLDVPAGAFSRALAVAHPIPLGEPMWAELVTNTDLLLDRIRILELLEHDDVDVDAAYPGLSGHVDKHLAAWLEEQ